MACRPSKVARRKTTNVALTRQQPTVLLMHASSIVEGRDVVAYAHAYTTPSTHEASAGPVQYTYSTLSVRVKGVQRARTAVRHSKSVRCMAKPGARGSLRATGAIGSLALSELTHAY